jgi:glycine cleavage system H protein
MPDPRECRFSESHEWFHSNGDIVTIGITQHAANELTDITYVEMKPPGTTLSAGDTVGEVESVKTTSEVYAVVGGQIVEINQAVADDPSLVNSDPYEAGWLVKVRPDDDGPLAALMDYDTYNAQHPVE